MARHEENREDLIAEATALVERIELRTKSLAEDVVTVGFRRNGFLSIYFEQDRFYQFDLENCLRRAYVSPFVYRAQFGKLCRLDRQRSSQQTTLVRTDLAEIEAHQFINDCRHWLQQLLSEIDSNNYQILRSVVEDGGMSNQTLVARIRTSLSRILQRETDHFSKTIAKRRMK